MVACPRCVHFRPGHKMLQLCVGCACSPTVRFTLPFILPVHRTSFCTTFCHFLFDVQTSSVSMHPSSESMPKCDKPGEAPDDCDTATDQQEPDVYKHRVTAADQTPEPPSRTHSPDILPRLSSCEKPTLRPLSPVGKAMRGSPMFPHTSTRPDMSHIKSRYLETSAGRSPTVSPSREAAYKRHYLWKLGKMHADVPDYKRSQPRMYESRHCLGIVKDQHVVTLKQVCGIIIVVFNSCCLTLTAYMMKLCTLSESASL